MFGSLYQINYPSYDVVLVDNNSEDDSLKKIEDYCNGVIQPESKYYTYNSNNKPIEIVLYQEEELEHITREPSKTAEHPSDGS